jgi:hypothetical protein
MCGFTDKTGPPCGMSVEALVGAIEIDPFEEDAMEMEVEIDGTAETLDKGH